MLKVAKLAPVAFAALAALAFAGAANAERGCDAANPLMLCPLAECIALQANVNSICKNPAPVSCGGLEGCNVLRREKQHWLDCYTARNIINARCWAGGDLGHQQAAAQAIQNVGICDARIALPDPIGCADPCP
jgi:hypothetical protein